MMEFLAPEVGTALCAVYAVHMTQTTTFKITVPVAHVWASGAMRGTGVRIVEIVEEATILGGCRAIEAAVAQCKHPLADASPDIEPNPALMGWALGA
jgi:hypothetical protein